MTREWGDYVVDILNAINEVEAFTAGMTRDETRQMAKLIRALADYAAVVVIDHDMEFVRILEAPITVLHRGAVFAEGSIEELRQNERVLDIYLGRRKHVGNL